jgi:oligoendopeptidase F
VNEVYRSAPPSLESSVHSSSKSSNSKKKKKNKKKFCPADNVLNIVAQKLQCEGTYTAFGKHIAQHVASFGDEMAKYCKYIY